jgi:carboxypeptidase Q
VIGYPIPGTRGTDGPVRTAVVAIDLNELTHAEDLEALRGTLEGKIVLTAPIRDLEPNFSPQAVRLSDEELSEMARLDIDKAPQGETPEEEESEDKLSRETIEAFLDREGVVVLVKPGPAGLGPMDKGVVSVAGFDGRLPIGEAPSMPAVIIAVEHYNRMMRLLAQGLDVEMEIELRNTLHSDDPLDRNVLVDIAGSDLANEFVLIGGHLDGDPAGTGATDNAAGSAVVMEAMRILQAIEAKPRRTIRAALWGAEEPGLFGSRGYVRQHLIDLESDERKTAHEEFSVYFNVDWYGRFRGIFLQGNDAARPIFEAWMRPFADVDMTWLVPGNTCCTDHMAFLEAGLPGFQFIQDDLEFFNVTYHTNMDVYDRLVASDLKQAAVILASFAYHAAMRDEKFPRADGINNGRRWHK